MKRGSKITAARRVTHNKPLRRRVTKFAAAILLSASVVIAILWIRSYSHYDTVIADFGDHVLVAASLCGAVDLRWFPDANGPATELRYFESDITPFRSEWRRNLTLLYAYREPTSPPSVNIRIGAPHWTAVLVCLLIPVAVLFRWWRRRRLAARGL